MLSVGMAQQLCVLSGAGAAISNSNVMGKLVQSVSEEQKTASDSLDGVLFDVWEKQGAQQLAIGVYYYDLNTEEIMPVLPEGYALQDVSPGQSWMLANQSENLWLISLEDSTPDLISDSFSPPSEGSGALFTGKDEFVYLQQQDNRTALIQHDIGSKNETRQLEENVLPFDIVPGTDNSLWVHLYPCEQGGKCSTNEEYWSVQDSSSQKLAVEAEQFWPATQNDQIAYANPSINTDLLYFADTLGFASQQLRLAGSYTLDANWHNDGRRIAVLRLKRDFTTHKVSGIGQHLIDTKTLSVSEYASLNGLLGQAIWHNDETLLVIFTQEETGTFQLAMAETNLQDGSVQQLSIEPAIQSKKMIFVRQIIGIAE
jgi:hypothetical protein